MTQTLYHESLRPRFHFTARQWTGNRLNPGLREDGWMNDLNGLIYYDGEYHLFAQRWNKCWIHAISTDLVHWTELQPAFWEEHQDSGVQSGTCVIDYKNSSRLSPDSSTPPMVAFWSRNDNRSQCISYSLDHGRTWKMYDKNPVLDHADRDPKVFWYAPDNHWVMMLYGNQKYHIFTSQNLLNWKDEHHPITNSFECPDFFELPVDGNPQNKKWILIRGDGKYSLGQFNGTSFTEETDQLLCDVGPNFYATQTWENTSTGDGRRIQTAWMRDGKYPDMPFNQQITFPCELSLRTTSKGIRLFREPIKEISLLEQPALTWNNQALSPGDTIPLSKTGDLFRIQAQLTIPANATLTFNILGSELTLTSNALQSGPAHAATINPIQTLEILIDRTSIEAFLNQGAISSSRCILPTQPGVSMTAMGSGVAIHSMTVHPLISIWKTPIAPG